MVYQLATKMALNGYVKNDSNGVKIIFNASEKQARLFFEQVKQSAPPKSKIISFSLAKTWQRVFNDFSILVEDDKSSEKKVLISPDAALCSTCRAELDDVNNRRYRYPFVTCTQCGPRYSIINKLPYERHCTAMQPFTMCVSCEAEYYDVYNRRFFSQTNSCADCGIRLSLYGNKATILSHDYEDVLLAIKNHLQQGKILAVKGIGGYLLLCDAGNAQAIQTLRIRKHRPSKPFAVLYPDIGSVEQNFELNNQEKQLLQSAEVPIVLLYPKPNSESIGVNHIAPGLKRMGVMLPYSPLLELMAHDFGKPLIATSANISGSAIIYKDEDALDYLFEIADYVISYNREIIIPQDDSVVQISKHSDQQIILRRSRGYSPSFLSYKTKTKQIVLSTGAFLKSSFTLAINGNVFVSQYLGSGESYESQLMYKQTLEHWLDMYAVKPDVIIADKHPGYFSYRYAVELAAKYNVEIKFIQHHEAHFASILAENNLIHNTKPVLGVIWDGTGLGDDGNIWGGEFFKYEANEMLRCYHFDEFPSIAGDKIALEPRIAALCAAHDIWPPSDQLKEKFTDTEWNTYQTLISTAKLSTTSVGRIFDAVASLLNMCDKQSYEGEAAMYLQALAEEYVDANGFEMDVSYFNKGSHYYRIPTASLMQGIMQDIQKGKAKNYIAAKFYYSMVCLIDVVACNVNVTNICFSGGVFQNTLLVDWIQHECSDKYQLYFHKNLPPNDENISFGQLVYYENGISTLTNDELVKRNFQQFSPVYN
jgi:hydrogenase maturation protein HypF